MEYAILLFGSDIMWNIIKKNIEKIFPNHDVYAYTDEKPPQDFPVEKWEKLSFIVDNKSYENPNATTSFTNHCFEKLKNMIMMVDKNYKLCVYYFGNNLYFSKNSLDSCRILSNNCLKIAGKRVAIKDLNIEYRKKLFSMIYKNVYDYENIEYSIDKKRPLILISSVIHINSEFHSRSAYDSEERFKQTVKQLKSIKSKIPNAQIFLLECSELSFQEMSEFSKLADKVILFCRDDTISYQAHKNTNKNNTEMYLLLKIIEIMKNHNEYPTHIAKMSGRYCVNDNFDEKLFFSDKSTFRVIPKTWANMSAIESIFYSVPKEYIEKFTTIIQETIYLIDNYGIDVEHGIYQKMFYNDFPINPIKILGVNGYMAEGIYNSV